MSSLSRIALVSALFCAQTVVACGGSADTQENPASGDSAGAGNAGSSAGAGNAGSSAGAGSPSAGRDAGTAGASQNPGPSGAKLSEIETDAQALALCNQIRSTVSDADLKRMLRGSCAIAGLTGEASQRGTCEELQAECASQAPLPSTDDGSCTADDIPDCDNVTVAEYIACTRATIASAIEYMSAISCDTDLESLEGPGPAAACTGPFARCPEYAAVYQ